MTSDFAFNTIRELSSGLAKKAFSPVELLNDVIRRYEVLEPSLNMFAYTDFDGAHRQAKAAEERMVRGERRGDLDGIPTSIKDLIAVEGMPQRFGSRAVSDAPISADAPSVERLRAAGAVILGKSTTSEFGCKAVGDSPLTGITRNPWNTGMTPGGSSAGGSAMVAAGLVPYAIGTDGGGSIRIPSAMTGLFGIKAQFGRVPVFPTSATPTLAHVGPMARTVEDASIVLSVIAGFDKRDPFSVCGVQPDFVGATETYRKMRIAWSPTLGYGRVESDIVKLTSDAVRQFEAMGHVVEEVAHIMDDPIDLWNAEFYAGVGTKLRNVIFDQPDLLDPAVLEVLQGAVKQEMKAYYENVFARYAFRERMRQFFEVYDVLLTPTVPVASVPAGVNVPKGYEDKNIVSWSTFTYPFNLTGNPSASIPVGFTAAGLPVGLQIVAPANDEVAIISLAGAFQRATDSYLKLRPPITL